mmetsp:Transcript_177967/g.564805  ORF Transcript_177967/g.564805 Transcript_177967/m.564805 type:complete len:133 (+) Transcript_177967:263-661(+)
MAASLFEIGSRERMPRARRHERRDRREEEAKGRVMQAVQRLLDSAKDYHTRSGDEASDDELLASSVEVAVASHKEKTALAKGYQADKDYHTRSGDEASDDELLASSVEVAVASHMEKTAVALGSQADKEKQG